MPEPTRYTLLPGILLCLAVVLGAADRSAAGDVLHPKDIARLHRATDFSSNWSGTNQFDLENPVELEVELTGIRLPPEGGAAHLLFTLPLPEKTLQQAHFEAEQVFHATLQTAGEFRRLRLSERDFTHGRKALLRGWPASDEEEEASVMLVYEIELQHSGRIISLHRAHPKMKRKSRGSPES
jgi:hypothetical protein